MTLATHAVFGAALAGLIPQHPILSFTVGFMSHFLADAIPHWDYKLASARGSSTLAVDMDLGSAFLTDLAKIACDVLLGLAIVFAVLSPLGEVGPFQLFLGALGGMMPDFLQFAYMKIRREPLVSLQRFHMWMHSEKRLSDQVVVGPLLQVAIVLLAVLLFAALS